MRRYVFGRIKGTSETWEVSVGFAWAQFLENMFAVSSIWHPPGDSIQPFREPLAVSKKPMKGSLFYQVCRVTAEKQKCWRPGNCRWWVGESTHFKHLLPAHLHTESGTACFHSEPNPVRFHEHHCTFIHKLMLDTIGDKSCINFCINMICMQAPQYTN